MVTGKSPDWLPPGFSEKIRVKDGRKIKVYTDKLTGSKFYSRPAVTRYLSTVSQCNTEAEQIKVDNVSKPASKSDIPIQNRYIASSGCNSEMKAKGGNFFKMVTSEDVSADGIPLGWIKEIRTSKSGKKIRKDQYFIDPSSGYTFSSKIDVLRYLETNDISSCATRPKKKELDEIQLIGNEIYPSTPANEKLSKHCDLGILNGSGGSSSAKGPEENFEWAQDDNSHPLEETKSCENSNKVDEMKITKQTDDVDLTRITKSKKRKGLSLPPRTSKRLAGYEPEIPANLVTSERAVRVAARRSPTSAVLKTLPSSSLEAAVDITPTADTKSSKEEDAKVAVVEETPQNIKTSKNSEKLISENQSIPDEKEVHDGTGSQEVKPSLDFRNSWSDPCLEFAFKTLTEEIPFEETLASSGCFGDKFGVSSNQSDKCFKPSESDAPSILQREILHCFEHLKKRGAVNLLSTNSISLTTCSGSSSQQSSSEKRNQAFQKLPANEMEKQADKAQGSLRKPKKSKYSSLSSQSFKGLAGCEPKVVSNVASREQAPRTAGITFPSSSFQSAADLPLPYGVNPIKETTALAFLSKPTLQKVENHIVVNKTIPGEKQSDDSTRSQESQLCYALENSWSDPCLEFAFKTLTGELPIEDTLAFSSQPGKQFGSHYNQADQCFKPSKSNVPISFQSEIPHSVPSKQNRIVDHLSANAISFPTSIGLSSQQSSPEARSRDYLTKVSFRK